MRALESAAFRTARTFTKHSERLATIRGQQHTAFRTIDCLRNAIGAPEERTIAQRLDTIERVPLALARTQGLGPKTAD